jgi:dynein heavy chain
LFKTALELLRLEKVEIGGVKGKALSNRVVKIFEEFKEEFEKFNNKKYDPLDPTSKEFVNDYHEFNSFVLDLDRRLSAIICQAFDDCNGLNSIFKLITILGNLLERKSIKQDFDSKYYIIANLLESEMDQTKMIYDEQKKLKDEKKQINVHRNMPDVSGALKWCQELRERINKPMESFKRLIDHPIVHSEQMERVEKKYNEMLELLDEFSNEVYKEWCDHVGKLSDNNLEKNLINRDSKTNTIRTNFDPQVSMFFES